MANSTGTVNVIGSEHVHGHIHISTRRSWSRSPPHTHWVNRALSSASGGDVSTVGVGGNTNLTVAGVLKAMGVVQPMVAGTHGVRALVVPSVCHNVRSLEPVSVSTGLGKVAVVPMVAAVPPCGAGLPHGVAASLGVLGKEGRGRLLVQSCSGWWHMASHLTTVVTIQIYLSVEKPPAVL